MNFEQLVEIDDYISNLFSKEDDILLATLQSIVNSGLPQHSIYANQGKFLSIITLMCNVKSILEIGTLAGYSTIWLARALPEDGKLITIELDPSRAKIAQENIKNASLIDKVEIRIGNALSVLQDLEEERKGTFDMVFIDADKPSYIGYFDWAMNHSHPGTVIIADNVIRNGLVLDIDSQDEKVLAVQRFNQYISERTDIHAIIIPNLSGNGYDGMALAIVR